MFGSWEELFAWLHRLGATAILVPMGGSLWWLIIKFKKTGKTKHAVMDFPMVEDPKE